MKKIKKKRKFCMSYFDSAAGRFYCCHNRGHKFANHLYRRGSKYVDYGHGPGWGLSDY